MKPAVNFICVGAQKSGTTSLHDILKQHEQVYLPKKKETHFFDDPESFSRGMDWYFETYFNDYAGERICGEITPEYLFFEEVPERLFRAFGPDLKLVFMLRNPVSRAYSHYMMSRKRTYESHPFEEAIALEEERIRGDYFHRVHFSYVSRGFYAQQIERYLKYFSKENMLFIRFEEDFVKNRQATMVEVCSFLGLDIDGLEIDIKSHSGKVPRYKWLPKFIYKPKAMRNMLSFLPHSIRRRVIKAGYGFALKERDNTGLSSGTKAMLYARYEAEIKNLERLIGKDLSSWSSQ